MDRYIWLLIVSMTEFYFHFAEADIAKDHSSRIATYFSEYSFAFDLRPRVSKYCIEGRGYADIWRLSVIIDQTFSPQDFTSLINIIQHTPNYFGWFNRRAGALLTENQKNTTLRPTEVE